MKDTANTTDALLAEGPVPDDNLIDSGTESCVERVEHPVWGVWTGNRCRHCDTKLYRHMPNGMCPDCVRETPGTEDCHICDEHGERICGYHSTALWYCSDCGHVRRIGNQPARPGTDRTVRCCVSLHPESDWNEIPRMERLCYRSVAPPQLRRYSKQRGEAWNEATREHSRKRRFGTA